MKTVPESTSGEEERRKVLIDSCIRDLDSMRMRMNRKTSRPRSWVWGTHAVSKFRRAVSMKITVEDRKRSNITVARFKRKKTVSERRRSDIYYIYMLTIIFFTQDQ